MQPWIYFLIIGALFFLMMRGGCGAHVMGHGHHQHGGGDQAPDPMGIVPASGPAGMRDPVCGMTIDIATAKTSVYRGIVRYFCSDECRGKFEASPEAYATPTSQLSE